MAERRGVGLILVVALLGGCMDGPVEPRTGRGDGPLVALTGEGATMGPAVKPDQRTVTWTFGTPLCSADPDADIVVDDVRYDLVPELDAAWDPDHPRRPSVGTWFRSVPTAAEAGEDALPTGSAEGGPLRMLGEVRALGEGLPSPIDHECDGYANESRTWPVVELLTVITSGPQGIVARRTYVDYHVGEDHYTVTIPWQVGFCGPAVPRDLPCPRR